MDGMLNSEKWTDEEVKALLVLYATEEVQRNLGGSTRNIKIFGKISSELAQMGVYHTVKQCREKVKKLKQDYKKIKDHNNQSGANRKSSKWYATLDGILGHRPPYSGNAATKDSATGFLETIVGSENTPPSDEILQDSTSTRNDTSAGCKDSTTSSSGDVCLDTPNSPATKTSSSNMTPQCLVMDSTTMTNIPVSYNITFIPCPPPAQTPCPTEDSQDPGSYSMQVEDVGIPCKSTVTLSALEMSDKGK
ncbi:uncharacterized protein LOC144512450 [Sander vitreus]